MINKKIFFICLLFVNNLFATVRIAVPYDLETTELNKEQRDKLQNIKNQESISMPEQYKGPLKYTEGEEEVKLRDVALSLGIGGRYTFINDIELTSNLDLTGSATYFNKINKWKMKNNFNFFASAGLYWRNGFRIELEYSEMTIDTANYGEDFARYNSGLGAGIIFNQYLQHAAIISNYDGITRLSNNMLPVAELSLKTYMLNFIFEKTKVNSKVRPYLGFGFGMVNGDFSSLVNEGGSKVFGAQAMVGLSYVISPEQVVAYLGYRILYMKEMEQTFTRLIGANNFDGNVYYDPVFKQSTETYQVPILHNIDLGFKFFF